MIDNVKTDIQTMRSLSIVRPQAMSFYSLLDKPGLVNTIQNVFKMAARAVVLAASFTHGLLTESTTSTSTTLDVYLTSIRRADVESTTSRRQVLAHSMEAYLSNIILQLTMMCLNLVNYVNLKDISISTATIVYK